MTALRAGLQAKLQTTSASEAATPDGWFTLLNELRGTLPQLSYTYAATPMNISLFNNYVDPLCGGRAVSADACFDGATSAHQAAHASSCRIGHWNGQRAWTTREMIQEEIAASLAEMNYLQAEIGVLACSCRAPFALLVQNGTVSNIQMPGVITGGSSRSLNQGQGIIVPITLHADGTFEGSNSGTDAGTAAGYGAGGSVHSQFGQAISIQATGIITPGQCNEQSCGPDVMHLALAGMSGPQSTQAQARFPMYSRDIHEVTQGGSGGVQFNLPAYIGQSAEQTLLDMGMLKSMISVAIVAPDGTSQAGAALLLPPQCRTTQAPPQQVASGGASGGAAGGGGSGGGGASSGGAGGSGSGGSGAGPAIGVVPSGGGNKQPVVTITVNETIHTADAARAPVSVNVSETVHVTDTRSAVQPAPQ